MPTIIGKQHRNRGSAFVRHPSLQHNVPSMAPYYPDRPQAKATAMSGGTMCRCQNPAFDGGIVLRVTAGGAIVGLLVAIGFGKPITSSALAGAGVGAGLGLLGALRG